MSDPSLFWMTALTGVGAFAAFLIRDYLQYLKREAEDWKRIALRGVDVAERAVDRVTE